MAYVLSVANQKGGVGKTTTAVNTAANLGKMGRRVLLVDLDPQGNATTACGLDKNSVDKTVYNVLCNKEPISDVRVKTEYWMDLLPSNRTVSGAELDLASLKNCQARLERALGKVGEDYDYIVIDTPPTLSLLTVNAFVASTGILIPMQCEYYALEGLSDLSRIIRNIRAELNPVIEIMGLLRVMYDARIGLQHQVSEQLVRHFGDRVFKTMIPRNIRLAEAPSHGMPGIVYDASSKGAKAYAAFAAELVSRLEKSGEG